MRAGVAHIFYIFLTVEERKKGGGKGTVPKVPKLPGQRGSKDPYKQNNISHSILHLLIPILNLI